MSITASHILVGVDAWGMVTIRIDDDVEEFVFALRATQAQKLGDELTTVSTVLLEQGAP